MLRFFLGKELTSKIADSLDKTISSKVGRAIDDNTKKSIDERKLDIEFEKLNLEREKFIFEKEKKFPLETVKVDLEKNHKEIGYKYPADLSAISRVRSSHIRGGYGILSAILIAGFTYGYFRFKEEDLKEKDGNIKERLLKQNDIYAKKTQLVALSLDKQDESDRCLFEVLQDPSVKKEEINEAVSLCKSKSEVYNEHLAAIRALEPQIKALEREIQTKTPRGGV